MNKLVLILSFMVFSSFAGAKVVECVDSDDTSLKMTASFDSTKPSLIASVISYKPDGTVEHETKTNYLTPQFACEVSLNFAADCIAHERQSSIGYAFDFQCKSKKVSGQFYVDENGNGNFSCGGQPGSSMFFGCKVP